MPEVPRSGGSTPPPRPHLPPTAGLDGIGYRTAAEAAPEPELSAAHRVGWGFISLYTLAYLGTALVLIAPLLVTLALKVNSLVGIDQAPKSLGLVTGIGALLAMVGNPFFGKMSDRTPRRWACGGPGWSSAWWAVPSASWLSRWPPASRSSSSDGASPSCSSTRCSPPWWRCCRTRSRPLNAAWSPVSSASVCRSRR